MRGEQLLLDAAHRQHVAAQRDLAGHRDVGFDRTVEQERGHRGEHRDARAGPVLGHPALRDVQVQIDALEPLRPAA